VHKNSPHHLKHRGYFIPEQGKKVKKIYENLQVILMGCLTMGNGNSVEAGGCRQPAKPHHMPWQKGMTSRNNDWNSHPGSHRSGIDPGPYPIFDQYSISFGPSGDL
jgi:hypothetical protein